MELVFFPLSGLSFYVIPVIVQKLSPEREKAERQSHWQQTTRCCMQSQPYNCRFKTFRKHDGGWAHIPAVFLQTLGLIGAVEEFALEELNCDNSEDEHEEDVHDEDVENVLQRVYDTVEHRLEDISTQSNINICKASAITTKRVWGNSWFHSLPRRFNTSSREKGCSIWQLKSKTELKESWILNYWMLNFSHCPNES